jgi:flagellar hook-associated protein 2
VGQLAYLATEKHRVAMARIQATTGLVSGIPIDQTVTELMSIASQPVTNLQNADTALTNQETALDQLSALLLGIQSTAQDLGKADLFAQTTATSSNPSALAVTVTGNPPQGTYQFTPVQTVQSQQWLGSGVASTTNPLGGGTISFRYGNAVNQGVSLSELNGGAGFSPGEIRITDGSGATATIDLSTAQTIDDVLKDINNAGTISVTATADGDHLVLTDTSGGSGPLKVQEVNGGSTAASLGLANIDSTTGSAVGSSILSLANNTPLTALNDGLGVGTNTVLPDISYTLGDGETGTIDLSPLASGATQSQRETTLGQILNEITTAINGNSTTPKVSLQIQGDRLVMTDLTTPDGTSSFQLQAINGSEALAGLGLAGGAVGNTITGSPILGGLKTVLLSDLDGGQGLGPLGQLQLTDQAGHGVTVDLSGAETLQDVVDTINTAAASAAAKVGIVASVNSAGDGIQLTDTSGGTQGSLTAADTQDGTTTATKLGIAGSSSTGVLVGSDLHLAAISGSTTLASLNGGAGVAQGTLIITDSGGTSDTLDLRNSNIQTVEDVVDAINRLKCNVHAQLDAGGDGIEIQDTAHGSGTLSVTEGNSTTAHDLHLLAPATTQTVDDTPTQVIDGSMTTTITLGATDSLSDLVTNINQSGAGVTASILSDGSSTPYRLALTATQGGSAARMVLSTSALGFSISQTAAPQNALLQMGSSGVLLSSSSNNFTSVLPGATLQIQQGTGQPVTVGVTTSDSNLATTLQSLVTDYNQFQQQFSTSTQYTTSTNSGAVLTDDPAAMQLNTDLSNLLSGQFYGASSLQSLTALGVTFNNDGTLSFDQSTLDAAFAANPSAVEQFFTTKTSGFSDQLNNLITQLAGKTNSLISDEVQGLQQTVTQNQQQITEMQAHLANEESQLYTQFYAMETAIAKLQNDLSVVQDISYIGADGSTTSTSNNTSSATPNLLTSGLSSIGGNSSNSSTG